MERDALVRAKARKDREHIERQIEQRALKVGHVLRQHNVNTVERFIIVTASLSIAASAVPRHHHQHPLQKKNHHNHQHTLTLAITVQVRRDQEEKLAEQKRMKERMDAMDLMEKQQRDEKRAQAKVLLNDILEDNHRQIEHRKKLRQMDIEEDLRIHKYQLELQVCVNGHVFER